MSSDRYVFCPRRAAYWLAGTDAGQQVVTSFLKNDVSGRFPEPLKTPGLFQHPLAAEGAVEAKKPRKQTGRRGKSKRGERSPEDPAMTVAEDPAALRDLILLTREQAAVLAGVGLNKIDEWSREPGFPIIREGGHFVRIVRVDFEEWLRQLAERLNPPERPVYRPVRERQRPPEPEPPRGRSKKPKP